MDAGGRQIVSIHAKITYLIAPDGTCRRADVQEPLLMPSLDPDAELIRETDVTPIKTGTDLIVLASAHAPSPGTREMAVRIGVNEARWDFAVMGDRRCIYRGPGSIELGRPEPFERMPLRYERAYGGVDENEPDPPIQHVLDAFKLPPGVYPRNPVGRGYVVRESPAIDGLPLPNIEHPHQRLSASTLIARGPEGWWRQPLPWSCDWFDKTWYPRVTYFGGLPAHLPDDDRDVAEVRLGLVPPRQNARHARLRMADALDARFTNAASPALVLPFLRGDEALLFDGVTPQGRLTVRLPDPPPRLFVRFQGRAQEVRPVLHRVLVSTEDMAAYVVWHGAWPTPRPLPARYPRAGDDARMELEGVDVFADGQRVAPLV
jgi:hypothetical protein